VNIGCFAGEELQQRRGVLYNELTFQYMNIFPYTIAHKQISSPSQLWDHLYGRCEGFGSPVKAGS